MHGVVAMGGVPSDPVSESNEDADFVSRAQNHNIFPGYFVRRRRCAVPREDLEFGIGWDQPPPPFFKVQISALPCCGLARISFTLKNFPLTTQAP